MKLEDIAKIVIQDLEALEKEKNGEIKDENLKINSAENLPNLGENNTDKDENLMQNSKSENAPNLAFSIRFEDFRFNKIENDEKSDFSDEISGLSDEKHGLDNADKNLQDKVLQDEFENLENVNFGKKNRETFDDFALEDDKLRFSQDEIVKISQNLQDEFEIKKLEILANLQKVKKNEIEFLNALKERVLVLFEGLNSFEGDLEARVELSIKFMEFLLASIDNRVETLSK